MRKALREAKRRTSWLLEHPEYERGVDEFTRQVLEGSHARRFLASFVPFVRKLSWFGMLGSLAQVTLRLAGPGVPDIYQGAELWNLSLVDPDNRRPVDFARRCQMLSSLQRVLDRPDDAALAQLFERWPDGRPKLFTLAAVLRLRRADKDLFLHGAYEPLSANGEIDAHVVAFGRRLADKEVVVVVPRFVATLRHGQPGMPTGPCWAAGVLQLPRRLIGGRLINVFTREVHKPAAQGSHAVLPLDRIFRKWPVAILDARET
jgi:(1->4)-alpha-D-glucan 1-alpha-D-glucosylmutase